MSLFALTRTRFVSDSYLLPPLANPVSAPAGPFSKPASPYLLPPDFFCILTEIYAGTFLAALILLQ